MFRILYYTLFSVNYIFTTNSEFTNIIYSIYWYPVLYWLKPIGGLFVITYRAWMQEAMEKSVTPGVAVAIIREGRVESKAGFGVASIEDGQPVTSTTLFRVGSITKPLTVALILKLVERGKLALDVPVQEYLPWFQIADLTGSQRVTLRMLLSHQSGLLNESLLNRTTHLREYVEDVVPHLKLAAPPGTLFSYSNANYSIAGCVAQEVMGSCFEDLMQQELFRPLGMERTTFAFADGEHVLIALGHELQFDRSLQVQTATPLDRPCHPAYLALSNAEDLAKFALMLLGQSDYLSPISLQEMQRIQAPLYNTHRFGYGLGLFVRNNLLYHFGDIAKYTNQMTLCTETGSAVITLANREFPHMQFATHVLDEQQIAIPVTASLSQVTGDFFGSAVGFVKIWQEEGKLWLDHNGKRKLRLRPEREDFAVGVDELGEVVCSVGFVDRDHLMYNNQGCHRIAERPVWWKPTVEELERYVGAYSHCGFLNASVRLEEDRLILRYQDAEQEMIPLTPHLFDAGWFSITEFRVDAEGAIVSYLYQQEIPFFRQS